VTALRPEGRDADGYEPHPPYGQQEPGYGGPYAAPGYGYEQPAYDPYPQQPYAEPEYAEPQYGGYQQTYPPAYEAPAYEAPYEPYAADPDAAEPLTETQPPTGAAEAEPGAPGAAGPDGGRAARRRAAQQQTGRASGHRRGAGGGRRRRGRGPNGVAVKESPGLIAVRVMGELFITFGVVMFLFVAYQLWWTNIRADAHTAATDQNLEKQWGTRTTTAGQDSGSSFPQGQTFAIIYIPKLDVEAPIAEGTDKTTILDKGEVGHYNGALETAFPWDATGNFALAGHRNTHGEPFRYINRLTAGDQVIVETAHTYYTYKITSTLPQTDPSNVSVIQPVPPQSGFTKPGRYITLTTCTPEFTSTYRLIVWGVMTDVRPRSEGKPAALGGG
jgi:sortase A